MNKMNLFNHFGVFNGTLKYCLKAACIWFGLGRFREHPGRGVIAKKC